MSVRSESPVSSCGLQFIRTFMLVTLWLIFLTHEALALSRMIVTAEAENEAARLVVMLRGQHIEGERFGAGIIIGHRNDSLYVVTANHTVRWAGSEVRALQVSVNGNVDQTVNARVTKHFDPRLDLAVIEVPGLRNLGIDLDSFPFDRLGNPDELRRGTEVVPLGYPNGHAWEFGQWPDRLSDLRRDRLYFESNSIAPGHSGGALLDEHFEIVGMIRADVPPHGEALSINRIIQQMKDWGYPIQLGEVPPTLRFAQVATTEHHACVLTDTGLIYCFGENGGAGELGHGAYTASSRLRRVLGGHRFRDLSVGDTFSCGLTLVGGVMCWGTNLFGQLGDGRTSDERFKSGVPNVIVGSRRYTDLSSGKGHTCALTNEGVPWCWGSRNAPDNRHTPQPTPTNLRFKSIFASENGACALTAKGQAFCWYLDPQDPGNVSPAAVRGAPLFEMLAIGGDAYILGCGVAKNGQAMCWGPNERGQLGDGQGGKLGSIFDDPAPVRVATKVRFRTMTVGRDHVCGLTNDGHPWCWGANTTGQLGDGTDTDRIRPVAVPGGHEFSEISAGPGLTCGIVGDNQLYCWGKFGGRILKKPLRIPGPT